MLLQFGILESKIFSFFTQVADSTDLPQRSAGSASNLLKRPLELVDSLSSSLEKSPFREPPKRRHRSASLGNLAEVSQNEDFRQLFAKEKESSTAMTTTKDQPPRSILKKSGAPGEDHDTAAGSSKPNPVSDEDLLSQSVQDSKFEPLTITRQLGSNNGNSRSVVSHSNVASTSSAEGSCRSSKKLFDGGRIPKKKSSTSETSSSKKSLCSPRVLLRSDPGWYVASTQPQKKCYILEEHELPPAELGNVRNHVYVRLDEHDPSTLVHVTLRKKNGRISNFIAESTQGWPGVPHLPYDLTRQIVPDVMSSGFVYGKGLAREKNPNKANCKK